MISREIIKQLDPLEQVIALRFLKEGRWVLNDDKKIAGGAGTHTCSDKTRDAGCYHIRMGATAA
ncbi:MAG: hypothetical protein WC277_03970 [Bacilli bacterium]